MKVLKTHKLFIGGAFVRSESGRSFTVEMKKENAGPVQLCQASRKDLRSAVEAAKAGLASWSGKTAFNRSQILYRLAEMTEGRREDFVSELNKLGMNPEKAQKKITGGVDALVYYAGWADKYQQVIGGVNPVSGPYHNFTTPGPCGVVGLIDGDDLDLTDLFTHIASCLTSGNSVVMLLGPKHAPLISLIAEIIATSDVPKGTVNLLTGNLEELLEHFVTHQEIQSLSTQNEDKKIFFQIREGTAIHMKRAIPYRDENFDLQRVLDFVEYKTAWHPIGT